MSKNTKFVVATAAALIAATVTGAGAALAPDVRCESGKLKATAAYASCLLKTEAKALTKMLTPDFAKCEEKINTKFPKLEQQAGLGVCPSEMDLNDIRDRTDEYEATMALLLSGGSLPPTPTGECGDTFLDAGEDCDVGELDGETCATQGFFNGTLACSPGCTFDTTACNATRFEDNGATVIDHQTGLEWEKKDNSNGIANLANAHDADNTYTWAVGASNTTQSGTAYSDFLVKLNGVVDHPTTTTLGCFENHCDWRMPTVDELKSILSAGCGVAPCIQDALLLPNRSGRYWTNSTRSAALTGAYFVDFSVTVTPVASDFKTAAYFTRAVRTMP